MPKKRRNCRRSPRSSVITALENNGGLLEAYPLSDVSRGKLLKIAREFHVRPILTGHVHYFMERKWPGDRDRTARLRTAMRHHAAARHGEGRIPAGLLSPPDRAGSKGLRRLEQSAVDRLAIPLDARAVHPDDVRTD